ncbi:GNAT family N-acetyltransferase [Vibrio sp. ZSDE26]|uniref:GNAT family N-acetyltransferase n=1 Tax=Vibrio amylolyticus TaxID=2847292 RepID=A0A9X1XM50_9VIBR|nr:GNAT family protein [Vibrio amylolyticus]MCK6264348.1 GNAT family N-acetyltransferase [Vibrio amylolyticus]
MFNYAVDDEIKLALVQESFAAHYAELVCEQVDYLSQWLVWPAYCQTEQDFRLFIQRSLHDYADGKSMTCAIIYNDKIVGNCSFNSIDHCLKKVEIGYWLSKQEQGKGIITRVVEKLISIAFEELDMEKVQLSAATENRTSRAVAKRVGMTLEGTITNQEKIGDQILDHAVYGIHRNQ